MDPAHRGRLWGHPAHTLVSVATQPLGEHPGPLDSGWGGLLDATMMRRIEPGPSRNVVGFGLPSREAVDRLYEELLPVRLQGTTRPA